MSKTEFGVNHPLAVKVFSKQLATEVIAKTYVGKFVGKGKSALVQEHTDLKKSAGDQITHGLRVQLDGAGIQGDATLEGNEEALDFYDDKVVVNQLRHATRTRGKMTEQRVPYNLRMESKDALTDWFAERMDTAFFNQICGYTAQSDTKYTGNNAVIAPSTNRIIRAGNQANDNSITSSDIFTLDLIDIVVERAKTTSTLENTGPRMRPLKINGEDHWVMFLHPYQVTQLRTNTSTGQWQDIQKAAMMGGQVSDNPIFKGSLGTYNNVILHEANRVTQGVSAADGSAVSTVRRAVLCGAQAAAIAFGGGTQSVSKYSWKEEMFDYGNQLGVAAGAIFGLKKSKYIPADDSSTNAEDFGTYVVSTYAAQTNPS